MNANNNPLLNDDDEDVKLPELPLPKTSPEKPTPGKKPEEKISSEMPTLSSKILPFPPTTGFPFSKEEKTGSSAPPEETTPSEKKSAEVEDDFDVHAILDGIDDGFGTELDYEKTDPLDEVLSLDNFENFLETGSTKSLLDFSTLKSKEDEMDFEGSKLDLDGVISLAIEQGASDIHLAPFDEVAFTVLGGIRRISSFGVIDPNMTVRLQQTIISNVLEQSFVEELELDTSYVVKSGKHKGRRLRLSVGKTESNIFMVFRVIADVMKTPDELEIPQVVRDWIKLPSGLWLINGPTGSGKSTTLSSLIQEIQMTRDVKVISIEKPIEYVYGVKPGQQAYITQREVGKDSRSFASALTSAMRQAPDIILVGEVRNKEEIDELLRAAETGHLAISTLHTTSGPATINRIRSMYEGDEQKRVLATLADNLRGMMTQTLVKTKDETGLFAVREVLEINKDLKKFVLNGDSLALRDYMEEKKITMEHELVKAVKSGMTSLESARSKAPSPAYFDEILGSE